MDKEKIIAMIIARGGSKSIPRKNVLAFHGKPLIAWPIELANSIGRIDRVIVSTDDDEIMAIAQRYGAETPFKRPADLADDGTPALPVLQHCLRYLEEQENYKPDIIVLLYPTSPLLSKNRIEQALDLFKEKRCNSVVSVVKDWGRFWKNDGEHYVQFYPTERVCRQYYKPLYRENGAMCFSRYQVIADTNRIIDESNVEFLIMEEDENIDIDTPEDFLKAERALI